MGQRQSNEIQPPVPKTRGKKRPRRKREIVGPCYRGYVCGSIPCECPEREKTRPS